MSELILMIDFWLTVASSLVFAYCFIKATSDRNIIFTIGFLDVLVFMADFERIIPNMITFKSLKLTYIALTFHATWFVLSYLYYRKIKNQSYV